jgi:hypothetical protein
MNELDFETRLIQFLASTARSRFDIYTTERSTLGDAKHPFRKQL